MGVDKQAVEVLEVRARNTLARSQRDALAAAQRAVHAATALQPEALPADVLTALHETERAADKAAAAASRVQEPPTLGVRLSADLPRESLALATSALRFEPAALSAALGVDILSPVQFATVRV